ncbi:MAG: T9SS type A sorting domain-containing protein, partial [Bacteroidota bacterium]
AELDQFQATGAMLPGIAPSFDCGLVSTHYAPNAQIQIYPNPASHWIHLQATVPIREIIIHDQLGKLIFQQSSPTEKVDVSFLLSGVYYIEVRTDNYSTTKKMLIE